MPLPVLAAPAVLAGIGAGGAAIALSGTATLNIAAAIAAGKAVGSLSMMSSLQAIKAEIEALGEQLEELTDKFEGDNGSISQILEAIEGRLWIEVEGEQKSITDVINDAPDDLQALQIKLVYPNDIRDFYYEINKPES